MKRLVLILLVLLPFCTAWQMQADPITPVVEYASSSALIDFRDLTLGYEFTTSVNFDVNALGYWNASVSDHQVGLWNSTGSLLTSTTVLSTDPITGHFRYHSIPDLLLAPGTYVIGGEFFSGETFPNSATGVISLPGYTWVTDEFNFSSGLNFPNVSSGGTYGDNGILLVDLSVTSTSSVPEPGTITLLLTGLGILALLRPRSPKSSGSFCL